MLRLYAFNIKLRKIDELAAVQKEADSTFA